MEYCFNLFNKLAADGTAMAVDKFLRAETPGGGKARTREEKISAQRQAALPVRGEELPVVLCIGQRSRHRGQPRSHRRLDAEI